MGGGVPNSASLLRLRHLSDVFALTCRALRGATPAPDVFNSGGATGYGQLNCPAGIVKVSVAFVIVCAEFDRPGMNSPKL